jgi:hypothetical protein
MEGCTAVGRATLVMLDLNRFGRQRIRQVEEAFGLYPPRLKCKAQVVDTKDGPKLVSATEATTYIEFAPRFVGRRSIRARSLSLG